MAHTEVRARYDELFHLCSEFFFYIYWKKNFQLFIYLPSLIHDKHTWNFDAGPIHESAQLPLFPIPPLPLIVQVDESHISHFVIILSQLV